MSSPRPPFSATALSPSSPNPLPTGSSSTARWQPILEAPVTFSRAAFDEAAEHLVAHPEYNSSTILRADVLHDSTASAADDAPSLVGYTFVRRVRRKLLPNRTRDESMEEECLFYEEEEHEGGGGDRASLLVLRPDLQQREGKPLPYFYPQVSAIAFRWIPPSSDEPNATATARIDFVSLPDASLPNPLPLDHRLYRTALSLLKQLCQVSGGLQDGYTQRVRHDLLVEKESVQDLYGVLKQKYRADIPLHSPRITFRWMLKEWKESTDPLKHVFEDVAIASWLIILWRTMFKDGRPPGGFVDVGCGNGLLVFILSQEGYQGYGVDLRARKSWPSYPGNPDLRVQTLDPIALLSSSTPPFPPHSFLIGNHSDELTPWLPLFAASVPGANFLSIPCCLHELSGRFTKGEYTIPAEVLSALPPPPPSPPSDDAPSPSKIPHPLLIPFYAPSPDSKEHGGRYFAYQLYLAHLTLECGFVPEREALRIPSTKNFGMLGRTRVWDAAGVVASEDERREAELAVSKRVQAFVEGVRGSWVARTPEGKAGEH